MVIPASMASILARRIYNFQFSNLKEEIPLNDSLSTSPPLHLSALCTPLKSQVYKTQETG
ncbi:MAG: hypothetical protein ACK46A_11825 [Akkermansiaceae bacterium]